MEKMTLKVNAEGIKTIMFHGAPILIDENPDGTVSLYNGDSGEVVIDGLIINQKEKENG